MPQNRDSGAAGNEYGHATAAKVANRIGATGLGKASNECRLDGKRIVIKCARAATSSVGVTYRMLDQLDGILGAFEMEDGSYDLLLLEPSVYREHMAPTRSTGASAGRVGIVPRTVFFDHAKSLGNVRLD
jgi:hypothetical protein